MLRRSTQRRPWRCPQGAGAGSTLLLSPSQVCGCKRWRVVLQCTAAAMSPSSCQSLLVKMLSILQHPAASEHSLGGYHLSDAASTQRLTRLPQPSSINRISDARPNRLLTDSLRRQVPSRWWVMAAHCLIRRPQHGLSARRLRLFLRRSTRTPAPVPATRGHRSPRQRCSSATPRPWQRPTVRTRCR